MPLNLARWAELSTHLDLLQPLSPLDRAGRLAELAEQDPELAEQLRTMLAAGRPQPSHSVQ
jgi:hypothetical protein